MPIILGASLGLLAAFLLALPAILLETTKHKGTEDLPLLIDVRLWRGATLTHREVFAVGLLIHLVIGMLYGLLYVLFAEGDWLFVSDSPYTLGSMLLFALAAWLVLSLIVFPLIGFGFFGKTVGWRVAGETLFSLLAEGVLVWIMINGYQPGFFA